jgi:drug/metabolite transporter (DMT)-like permease
LAAPSPVAIAARDGFSPLDWATLSAVALMWGSSFLLIDLGVAHLEPALVAWLRLAFGAATLGLVPAARRRVPRSEWRPIALLALVWMAVPFVLFPIAQQWIESSLAGMINAAAPLFTAVVAGMLARELPGARRAAGLFVGFAGVVAITVPQLGGAESTALGVGLVVAATACYGIALNLTGPLQQRNGALPVIWRAQVVALVLVAPAGIAAVPGSEMDLGSLAAVAVLGALGTALAFVLMSDLVGRVGSTRASVTIYFLPVVAIVLGALFLDESIETSAILGTALVIAGAAVVSRSR